MKQQYTKLPLILPALLLSAAGFCAMSSCSNSSHLLLYQQSNLGLNAAINPATQNLHVRIGLRRQFGAIVPKYALAENGESTQAASAYFGSRARVTSPFRIPEVAEVMATGRAAVIAAQGGNALDFAKKEESTDTSITASSTQGTAATVSPPKITGPIPPVEP